MRGSYKSGQRRVLSGSGYKIAIGAAVLLAVALVLVLLAYLPATEDVIVPERTIVSIENTSGGIGVNNDPSAIYVTVTYSDGTTESVSLASTVYEGLDLTVAGSQNVALSYGGFEQTVTFEVKEVDCVLNYSASLGGRIQGEAEQYVPNGGSAATVVAVPETGYVFSKWNDGYPYASRKDVGVTESKKYIAIFEKAQFTVRFYYDDGTVASEEKVLYGEAPTKVPVYGSDPKMEKYGYVFTNWVPADFSVVDRDMVIRPEYTKAATDVIMTVPLDVYGNAMGTTDIRSEGYYAHDALATIVATPYNSREFAYWLIKDASGNYVKLDKIGAQTVAVGLGGEELTFTSNRSGDSITDYLLSFTPNSDIAQIEIQAIFAYSNSDITFINYQNPNNNNVEFTVTGLAYGKPLNSYKNEEAGIDLTQGLPSPADVVGMEFEGWYLMGDPEQKTVDGSITFEQPTSLIAKWKRVSYTVVFYYADDDNNRVELQRTSVTYQDTLASGSNGGVPSEIPKRRNYVFVGWQDALTGATVDDKTKLYAEEEHLLNEDFVKNRILYIIPIWTPISHRLYVDIGGSGSVKLIINDGKTDSEGNSLTEIVDVFGEYTIYENNDYKLRFEAAVGFEIDTVEWYVGDNFNETDYTDDHVRESTHNLVKTEENRIYVEFGIINVNVTVRNGDSVYSGHLEYQGNLFTDENVTVAVNYNTAAEFRFISPDPAYSIKDIEINGVSIGEAFSSSTTEYTLALSGLTDDATVTVEYSARKQSVSLNVGAGGTLYVTDIYDTSVEIPATDYYEFVYGSNAYFRIKADGTDSLRNVLSSVLNNGSLYDLFSNAGGIKFYNWKINGVDYGISLSYINGVPYYVYGTASYNGSDYVYTERTDSSVRTVFLRTVDYGQYVYTALDETSAENKAIADRLASELKVSERSVYNTYLQRDRRITQVDFMLIIDGDYDLRFDFDEISYKVTSPATNEGTVKITSSSVPFNGTSTLVATPKAGYYISAYRINGGEPVSVNLINPTDSYSLKLNGITEDKTVEFIFEEITYDVVLVNDNPATGNVYADGVLLNNSVKLTFGYHDYVTVTVTVDDGYRISALFIDGKEQTVHYNTSSYVINVADMSADVTVRIQCAEKTDGSFEGGYEVSVSEGENFGFSAEAYKADPNKENVFIVTSDFGYSLGKVILKGNVSWTFDANGTDAYSEYGVLSGNTPTVVKEKDAFGCDVWIITVPAGTFASEEKVSVTVISEKNSYGINIVTEGADHGSTTGISSAYFGDTVKITLNANNNCYIKGFYVGGEAVSFNAIGWSGLTVNAYGNYTYGVYSFIANRDMDIRVEYDINTYLMTVDSSSVNGTTTLNVEGSVLATEYVPHGSNVYIDMEADEGYHIAGLYINDVAVSLSFAGSDVNTFSKYTYRYSGPEGNGVTGRLNVRVVYEINRYSFVFSIVNASANFANEPSCGTLTADFTLDGNRYTGIEHGRNFSFTVTPDSVQGYFLSYIIIKYRSSSGVEYSVTKTYTDGIFDSKGGVIWFNRFLDFDEGISADIELIEVVFERNLYTIDLNLLSASETGSLELSFSHPTLDGTAPVLFDGEGNKYLFSNGIFRLMTGDTLTDTDIKLVYSDGKYVYMDGAGKEYVMYIEHGLRYTLTARPTQGYERIGFVLNGDDASRLVNNDRYSANIVRNLVFDVTYRILVYDVNFSLTVVDKNLIGSLPSEVLLNYANIRIQVMSGTVYDADYNPVETDGIFDLQFNKTGISLFADYGYKLGYGTRIILVMQPKFEDTGYYLYNAFYGNTEIPASYLEGDVYSEVFYGGSDPSKGLLVSENVNARCNFRIKLYSVTAGIVYDENIIGETMNSLTEESGGMIAWGDDGNVRMDIGEGFILDRITVERDGEEIREVNLIDSADNDAFEEQMYYDKRNELTNEVRDVLVIKNVKGNVDVVAYLSREEFTLRYVFNDSDNLEKIETTLNENNSGYPQSTVVGDNSASGGQIWERENVHVVPVKYYDEAAAVITPKNGYEIIGDKVLVRAVKYDENSGEWVPVTDGTGAEIVTELNLVTVAGDAKKFTFHNDTSLVPVLYVSYDLEISIDIRVKTYTVKTNVVRTDANVTNPNTTQISMSVKDRDGFDIILSDGSTQTAQNLTLDNPGKDQIAEHHGYINYVFNAPEGYMLDSMSVNGVRWDNFRTTSFSDERMIFNATYNANAGRPYYTYVVRLNVNDALATGENYYSRGNIDVNIVITPITYNIKTYINGVYYENTDIGGRSGATDGKTVSVLSPAIATHFNGFTLEPVMYEGYEAIALSIFTGTFEEGADATHFTVSNPSGSRYNNATNGFMPYVNVLEDKLTIHIYYQTRIITYIADISNYAYSFDTALLPDGSEGKVGFDTVAGKTEVFVTTNGEGITYEERGSYEYFSTIRVDAYAKEGYRLYSVVEVVDGKETDIVNGVRGIGYTVTTDSSGREVHSFVYTVDSYGDRTFKIIFKQRTQVTLNVYNPYKYTSGTISVGAMVYRSYVSLSAYENGNLLTNANVTPGEIVVEKYVFDVLVGNFISFEYKDLYSKAGQLGYNYYVLDDNGQFVSAGFTKNALYPGEGKIVNSQTEIYLVTEVYARVTFEKETFAADENAVGGIVYFNGSGSEPSNQSLYSTATIAGKTLTITASPYDNYVFSNLYVRQIDKEASRRQGEVVYKTGSAEWLAYSDSFAEQDSNGFSITRSVDARNNTVFTVVMKGDMELRFEFYRVYELTYGEDYTDNEPLYGSASSLVLSDVIDNNYADAYPGSGEYVQYNASFRLSAPEAKDGYVFVGWYVNGVNTYSYLASSLPAAGYNVRDFFINYGDMPGLLLDGNEYSKLEIIAVYQPVIDVALINELYYYDVDTTHWNSWESGALYASYYDFNGKNIAGVETLNALTNFNARTLTDSYLDYSAVSALSGGDNDWNLVRKEMDSLGIAETNKVYSNLTSFQVLYQSIPAMDFVNNTWEDGIIYLSMEAMPSSVKLLSWQYYNWNSRQYEEINYVYEDRSLGVDSTGNYTVVDNTFTIYNFALSYIYSGEMPYAISASDAENHANDRPLIIRPKLWKIVQIELSQAAFTDYLGGNFTDDFVTVIHPVIDSVSGSDVYYALSDDGMTGEFDYGAEIVVKYYHKLSESVGGESVVVNYPESDTGVIDMCYRFIGWQLNWTVNGITEYRIVSTDDALTGYRITLSYEFGNEPPNEAMEFRALYITQYKQSVYSYNVAGSDAGYEAALNQGSFAVEAAPRFVVANTNMSIPFLFYDIDTKEVTTNNILYSLDSVESTQHLSIFMMDVGGEYRVSVYPEDALGDAEDIYNEDMVFGYDPEYDKEYMRYINKGTDSEQSFAPGGVAYTGEKFSVSGNMTLDLQYISTVKLIFENMMFSSGVTLPAAFVRYLEGDKVSKMTVWDVDEKYGDGSTVPDGTVHVITQLVNVGNLGGRFDYSLNGFKSGNGIRAQQELVYKINASGTEDNESNLFNPTVESYRRYVVIDYNDGYIVGGSLLFGDENYSGNKYSTPNTGDGTVDSPYKIYTVTQFKNLSLYFIYNEYSCVDVNFRLERDLKLQQVNSGATEHPYGNTKAWVPLTHYNDSVYGHLGFDGVLDGNNKTIYGLAVNIDNITPLNDSSDPLADFDYEALSGYGIFGCVNGGTIKNLNIGNAFIELDSFGQTIPGTPSYIGILAARAYNAVFENISFKELNGMTDGRTTKSNLTGISRVYLVSYVADGIGMLAGYANNVQIRNVDIEIASAAGINIDIIGATAAGGLVGHSEGENTYVNDVSVNGANGRLLINVIGEGLNSGGLFGVFAGGEMSQIAMNNMDMIIGCDQCINVGGVVGSLKNKGVISGVEISSANQSNRNDQSKGIILTAGAAASSSDESMGSSGETAFGKAGGIAGYVRNGQIISQPENVGVVNGVIRFYAGTAGGIAGVTYENSLIQGFNLNAPSSDAYALYLMFRIAFGGGNGNYGGIVGANLGKSTINDCSFSGHKDNSPTAGVTSLTSSYIYVYRQDRDDDTAYQNIPAVSTGSYGSIKKTTVVGHILSVGGMAGYNTAKIYNSFTKNARITVKYENGAALNDGDWKVRVGGIAGYFNVVSTAGTYTGWGESIFAFSPVDVGSKIQSCYTYKSSIAIAGYIWCDNNSNMAKTVGLETGTGVVVVGGIVGATPAQSYGSYGINSCYTYQNHFDVSFGAFGLNNYVGSGDSAGDPNIGWYYTSDLNAGVTGHNIQSNRAGFHISGSIYGIVGDEYNQDAGSVSNYCWTLGNTANRLGWRSLAEAMAGKYDRWSKPSADYQRGLDYWQSLDISLDTGKAVKAYNSTHNRERVPTVNDAGDGAWGSVYETNTESELVIGDEGMVLDFRNVGILCGGGFVGVYGNLDGRVYRTDVETGELMVAHWFSTTRDSEANWGYIDSNGNYVNRLGGYYLQSSKFANDTYLVRGQDAKLSA